MKHITNLCDLPVGGSGTVQHLSAEGALRTRLMELGLIEGTLVTCTGASPLGDPRAYMIRGAVIALRSDEASNIKIGSD